MLKLFSVRGLEFEVNGKDDFGLSFLNFLLNPWYFYTVEYYTSYKKVQKC